MVALEIETMQLRLDVQQAGELLTDRARAGLPIANAVKERNALETHLEECEKALKTARACFMQTKQTLPHSSNVTSAFSLEDFLHCDETL